MADEKETKQAPAEDAKAETKEEVKVEEKKEEAPTEKVEEKKEEAPAPKVEVKEEAKETKEVEVPKEFKALVDQVESMSVLELHKLVKLLEEKFGVSAQAVAVAGPAAAGAGEEEQTSFNVELTAMGDQKIAVIKVVKAVLGLGLKEAKDLVEAAPSMLKEGLKKEEAEDIKKQVEDAGGQVTLK